MILNAATWMGRGGVGKLWPQRHIKPPEHPISIMCSCIFVFSVHVFMTYLLIQNTALPNGFGFTYMFK